MAYEKTNRRDFVKTGGAVLMATTLGQCVPGHAGTVSSDAGAIVALGRIRLSRAQDLTSTTWCSKTWPFLARTPQEDLSHRSISKALQTRMTSGRFRSIT
jgi:hypothetical protein